MFVRRCRILQRQPWARVHEPFAGTAVEVYKFLCGRFDWLPCKPKAAAYLCVQKCSSLGERDQRRTPNLMMLDHEHHGVEGSRASLGPKGGGERILSNGRRATVHAKPRCRILSVLVRQDWNLIISSHQHPSHSCIVPFFRGLEPLESSPNRSRPEDRLICSP